ncbi:MAG: hypothetical protein KAI63_04485 [Planctomycetes bacterium]|nr:hypothetical protein [Planctomycetota bacterium]
MKNLCNVLFINILIFILSCECLGQSSDPILPVTPDAKTNKLIHTIKQTQDTSVWRRFDDNNELTIHLDDKHHVFQISRNDIPSVTHKTLFPVLIDFLKEKNKSKAGAIGTLRCLGKDSIPHLINFLEKHKEFTEQNKDIIRYVLRYVTWHSFLPENTGIDDKNFNTLVDSWATWWQENKDKDKIEWAIDALKGTNDYWSVMANTSLCQGRNLFYNDELRFKNTHPIKEEKEKMLAKWKNWYKENKAYLYWGKSSIDILLNEEAKQLSMPVNRHTGKMIHPGDGHELTLGEIERIKSEKLKDAK